MTSSQGEYFVPDSILVIVPSSSFLVLEKQPDDLTLSYIAHTLTSRYSELPRNNILCYYFICRNFNANINYSSFQYFLNMNYGPFSNIKIPAYANLARGHFSKELKETYFCAEETDRACRTGSQCDPSRLHANFVVKWEA